MQALWYRLRVVTLLLLIAGDDDDDGAAYGFERDANVLDLPLDIPVLSDGTQPGVGAKYPVMAGYCTLVVWQGWLFWMSLSVLVQVVKDISALHGW